LYIMPGEFAWVLYLAAQPAFQFVSEPWDAALLYHILHACMLAVLTVTIIALDRDNRLYDFQHFVNGGKAKRRGEPRMSLRLAMRHTHATANQYGETLQLVTLNGS